MRVSLLSDYFLFVVAALDIIIIIKAAMIDKINIRELGVEGAHGKHWKCKKNNNINDIVIDD